MIRFAHRVAALAALASIGPPFIDAQTPYAPDTPEAGSVEAIARFTTEPRFVSPWVAYVPASSTVTSPTKYLGHVVGAAGELSNTTKIYGYMRELARTSPRVSVQAIGQSEEGREILLAAIADEEGMRRLDELKAATAALADPRKTTPEQAERIIETARPIYYLNAGLHSTETGSPEMVMELAYRLAVSDQPMIRQIRENLIVLINPVAEPDGRDKMADWFYRHLKGKTDYENLPRRSPPYWGKYVYHDNNRDTHQKALALTRAVHGMFYEFHPTVVHDLHESIPLLQTWNGTGPWNPNLDPILIGEMFDMSFEEVRTLTALGMPGVWTWGFGEGFGHHYLESVAVNHNAIGRGYETFGNGTAETMERVLRDARYVGRPVTSQEWYRPWPPDKKLRWSLRNNTNYMQTGCLAILSYTARNARDMLRNFYRKGHNSWQKGQREAPYAIAIPAEQGDRLRVAQLVNLLRSHRIEVHRAPAPLKVGSRELPPGSFVVRMDQPYRNYAVDLLLPQKFPSDSEHQPYDDVSWSLPVHYGLEAIRADDAGIREAAMELVKDDVRPAGRVEGAGPVFVLRDTGQESLLAARHRLETFRVEIAERPFAAGSADYPAGSWLVADQSGLRAALEQAAAELALDFASLPSMPDVPRHEARVPRLAVWHTWADTQAVGWIRYTLDQRKVPYAHVRDEEIRAGGLRQKYDIILHGHVGGDLQSQIHGIDPKSGPLPYTKTAEFPSHGTPDASDDITGGIGWGGMANLQQFLNEGGTLITLGNGSALALDGTLVRGVRRASGAAGVWTPGVELKARFTRPDHPIAYGYAPVISAFRDSYPVYDVRELDRRWIVLQWGTRPPRELRDDEGSKGGAGGSDAAGAKEDGPMLVSGGIRGDDALEGRPAILDLPAGGGRVIAFNLNPMHRDLNRSDYRLLWNAILNWNALPPAVP
ncbi:MAG TPA: M14 family zinc carboxypeptidase [Vicinamibacterales bacterium]|nr:M14 family zinc carboxypeptidase [Vicinamibacterales bacterium]